MNHKVSPTLGQCLADHDQRIVDVNDAYCELVGRDRSEIIGVHALSFTYAADLVRNRPLLDKLSNGASPFVITKRYVRPTGELVWVRNHVSAFPNGSRPPLLAATCELLPDHQGAATLAENLRLAGTVRDTLRRGRETLGHTFNAPPAELLLLLYIAELEGKASTLEALASGADLHPQLVRRWLLHLAERGLGEILFDDGSVDRTVVRITRRGELALEDVLSTSGVRMP